MRDRLANESAVALAQLASLAATHRVAVLCVERDVNRCHRSVVIDEVSRRLPAVTVVHLGQDFS
jgi:uncharacterized protein (DUF488 family)